MTLKTSSTTVVRGPDGRLYSVSPMRGEAVQVGVPSGRRGHLDMARQSHRKVIDDYAAARPMVDPGDYAAARPMVDPGDYAAARPMVGS